jgi:hypothetical protein
MSEADVMGPGPDMARADAVLGWRRGASQSHRMSRMLTSRVGSAHDGLLAVMSRADVTGPGPDMAGADGLGQLPSALLPSKRQSTRELTCAHLS